MTLETKLKVYRIHPSEYQKMKALLGREPLDIEWPLFSALWSEHCSYKSSKTHLKKFRFKHPRVLEAEGENAGIVDLGRGEKIAFKMESHNHPSFIEPFQGAATGVGGILRDIFTMGARPIALADYLCFGEPQADRMKSIVSGVVKGISSYGNCVGVPTLTGKTTFHKKYNRNVLVNAMAVGLIVDPMKIAKSTAKGPGNWVVYVGAKTGKDGVHGASMASESFGEDTEAKKPNVQIGDPFYEKLLIEACLEVIEKDLVVAMQDMGAAGLTSSSFEMSAKSGFGFELNLDQVPCRDQTMTPEEILLSESQERMLLICKPDHFEQLKGIFSNWDLDAVVIGKVREEKEMKILWKSQVLTEIDPQKIVDQAPQYDRPFENPYDQQSKEVLFNLNQESKWKDWKTSLDGISRYWIYEQYDQRVGLRTVRDANHSFGVLRLPSGRGLGITVGCRPELMNENPVFGAWDSVMYPALKFAIKGFKPLAITDCLNFGNPENKKIMGEFASTVEILAQAARILDAPVVSGNVSFYNETMGENIISTPAIGMIGIREHLDKIPGDFFEQDQELVYMIQENSAPTQGSFDPHSFKIFLDAWMDLNSLLVTSKTIGLSGLINTLSKMTFKKGWGFSDIQLAGFRSHKLKGYGVIVGVEASNKEIFENKISKMGFTQVQFLGKTSFVSKINIQENLKSWEQIWN